MNRHTPGPWRINEYGNIVAGEERLMVQGVMLPCWDHPKILEIQANSRLIASAPDLLELAEEVRRSSDARLSAMASKLITRIRQGENE